MTHDGGIWVFREENPEWDIVKPITIGDNVYIGREAMILPGVTIGDNVVIGARSVVTSDLEGNAVYVGVSAKKIRTLDEYKQKIQSDVENTKMISKLDKRRFYLNKFRSGK